MPDFRVARRAERNSSFYLLLIIPLVMMLSLHAFLDLSHPQRFALVLICLFLFFGIAILLAIVDLFELVQFHLRETRASFLETLGDEAFVSALAAEAASRQIR